MLPVGNLTCVSLTCLVVEAAIGRQACSGPVWPGLQQQVEGLAKRKAELQEEDEKPQLGPEDQRAALLARIKADNEAVEVATQQAKQATEAVRQLERQAGGSAPQSRYTPKQCTLSMQSSSASQAQACKLVCHHTCHGSCCDGQADHCKV